jgi:trimethylamine--corrinoid protein Co-methyltransferase
MPRLSLNLLSPADIDEIHRASIHILERTGVLVPHAGVLQALAEHGAQVDRVEQRVCFPEAVIEWALSQAPHSFTLHGRSPDRPAHFGEGHTNLISSPGQIAWFDPGSFVRRDPLLEDVRRAARLGDALQNISIVGALGVPADVPLHVRDVVLTAELVRLTTKPTRCFPIDRRSSEFVLEIYAALAGGTEALRRLPMAEVYLDPVSPLTFSEIGIEIAMPFIACGQPVSVPAMPMAGATAPVTLAGVIAQANAEILAGIVIVQALAPGNPVMYAGIPHLMDLRSGIISFGSPEQGLLAVAMAEMGKHYGLPVYVNTNLTDARRPDAQAGMEKMASLLLGLLAGADLLGHAGLVGNDNGGSLIWLLLDHEALNFARRIAQGFPLDDASLALDIIDSVGPGGYFLDHEHTYRLFRQSLWHPTKAWNRDNYDGWIASGATDFEGRAATLVEQTLATHQPAPLEPGLDAEIERITDIARHTLQP